MTSTAAHRRAGPPPLSLLVLGVVLLLSFSMLPAPSSAASTTHTTPTSSHAPKRPRKLIVDTDLGQFFDDSWALGYLAARPDLFDVRLVLTAIHNTPARARIAARYLTEWGADHIPIGVGLFEGDFVGTLEADADFPLHRYKAPVYKDGIAAAAEILMTEPPGTVMWLAIAPHRNFAELARRFPMAVARLGPSVAMFGALATCWHDPATLCPEYNALYDVTGSRFFLEVFTGASTAAVAQRAVEAAVSFPSQPPEPSRPQLYLVPLDACPEISMDLWSRLIVANSTEGNVLVRSLLTANCLSEEWSDSCPVSGRNTMIDPVAAWLAGHLPELPDLSSHEQMFVGINDTGFTQPLAAEELPPSDPAHQPAHVIKGWLPGGADSMFQEIVAALLAYRLPV